MKPSWRDHATILFAFTAVFLCGYGIGHLVGARRSESGPSRTAHDAPAWERQTLQALKTSLNLRPEQVPAVEKELTLTAQAIAESHQEVILDYHHHLDRLYQRLIEILDEEQCDRLRVEKKALEKQIEVLQN